MDLLEYTLLLLSIASVPATKATWERALQFNAKEMTVERAARLKEHLMHALAELEDQVNPWHTPRSREH